MSQLTLEMDKISLDILETHVPGIIAAINAALDHGDSARQIEKALFKRFGTMSLTAALAAGAAHYLETQRQTCPICKGKGTYTGVNQDTGHVGPTRCHCRTVEL